MFSAFFGNYLLNKGIVTGEQLSQVLENQRIIRLKLGMLAINAGYMNARQVDEIHELQALKDKRFGDLAIEKGYLTSVQLDALLKQQKSEHLLLAQALIDDGLITIEGFEKEINNYKKEHGLTDEQLDALKHNNVEMVVHAFLAFGESTLSKHYSDYVTLFLKNMIRFIDADLRIDRVEKIDTIQLPHLVRQTITGDARIFTGLSGEELPFITLAGRYADEHFDKIDEYPIDAAGEFLNFHNGLFTVNLSDEGIEMTLDVQSYLEDSTLTPTHHLYHIPIYTSFGVIDLIIGQL
jgi:hypothetical protein